MTEQHFSQQLNRLQETYGKTAYGTERVKILWREVKDLSPEWLTGTVDAFLGSMRQAPLIPEFAERASAERERLWKIQKDQQVVHLDTKVHRCGTCRDNGVYLCTLNGDRTKPYAFRCHCSRGNSDPRKVIPQYKQTHAEQGFTYYEIGWATEVQA